MDPTPPSAQGEDAPERSDVPKDDLLFEIADKTSSLWKEFGRMLHVPEEKLSSVNMEQNRMVEKAFQMLLLWKRGNGRNATVKTLLNVLNEIGRQDVAEYLQDNRERTEKKCRQPLEVMDIAKELVNDWKPLGIKLEISQSELEGINADYNHSVNEKACQMLSKWQKENGRDATSNKLIKALCSIGRRDLAEKLQPDTVDEEKKRQFTGHVYAKNHSLNIPTEINGDDRCRGALTMFCCKGENYYALTCAHVACDTQDLRNEVLKIADTTNARNTKDDNIYFYQPPNCDDEIQLGTFPCSTVSKFSSESDMMYIKVGKKEDFKRFGGDDMKNLALNFKEINEELYKTANSNKGDVEVRTSNHVTGFISERNFSYIDENSTTIFKNAVIVKSSASFLEKNDSGTLVYFKDLKDVWWPFAYAVCKINDDDNGSESHKYNNNGNCEDSKEYYLCLKLDKALQLLDLKDCEFFIESEDVNHGTLSN
ncbi:uncharacterized protein LOC124439158 [Xenia sp. Carnegie-2017]|uniref:uncharacterized protein LOC124439158 n=1 Tax=Xenia sp. Carnegie-2017 TaxID=2897299 RepID=UPI001F04660E|nr:uncharacterized protein LOC124439158 [Xenia sp. Carnegie-2017]